jgi:hypothetical protein
MKYPTTLLIAALVCSTAAAAPEQVTCDSPCDCHNAHGEGRWSVKTDASLPPTDASAIQAVTPSEMFSWPGSDVPFPGVVVCEGPAKPQWCEIRTTVFSWTPTRFPFHTGTAKKLTFGQSPIITVIGKAFLDVGHAPKDQSNRRKYMPDYAVWEIHPVMKLHVDQ